MAAVPTGVWRLVLALLATTLVLSTTSRAFAIDLRSGEQVTATGDFADMLLIGAREAELALTSSDDVFVAAREVRVRQTQADHLFVAAASAFVSDAQVRDLLSVGGELMFEGGGTTDDLVAAGGSILVRPGFRVGGSALLSGGRIDVAAPVGGDLVASGGSIRIDGVVGRDAELSGDKIVIGPNARIGGDLALRAKQVEISPAAVIQGRRLSRAPRQPEPLQRTVGAGIAAAAIALLIFAIGGAVLVLAAVWAFPGLMHHAAGRIEDRPLATLGVGLLLLLGGPAAVLILLLTIVGIPLALLVLALYLAALPLAVAAVVNWAGMRGRRALARGRPSGPAGAWGRVGWSLLAVIALLVLGLLPVVGALLWLAVYVLGLGAVVTEARRALAQG